MHTFKVAMLNSTKNIHKIRIHKKNHRVFSSFFRSFLCIFFAFNDEITNIRSNKGVTLPRWLLLYDHANRYTVSHTHFYRRYIETQGFHKRFQLMRFLLSIVTSQQMHTRCFFIIIWSSAKRICRFFRRKKNIDEKK